MKELQEPAFTCICEQGNEQWQNEEEDLTHVISYESAKQKYRFPPIFLNHLQKLQFIYAAVEKIGRMNFTDMLSITDSNRLCFTNLSRFGILLQKTLIMLLPREQALELLNKHIKNERMIAHCLASEAVLRALAERLGHDADQWGQAGLLHDLDVEVTNADPYLHGPEGARWLAEMGIDAEVVDAIAMHNEVATGKERSTGFQHAWQQAKLLRTDHSDHLCLSRPEDSFVKPKSVVKRMKEKAFAASVKRENILECEKIGIPLEEFSELAIRAMSGIAEKIGL
jgi:putative nucleotidyltransferase with HDIG domain